MRGEAREKRVRIVRHQSFRKSREKNRARIRKKTTVHAEISAC